MTWSHFSDEVLNLAERLSKGEKAQPELGIKGQKWYRDPVKY